MANAAECAQRCFHSIAFPPGRPRRCAIFSPLHHPSPLIIGRPSNFYGLRGTSDDDDEEHRRIHSLSKSRAARQNPSIAGRGRSRSDIRSAVSYSTGTSVAEAVRSESSTQQEHLEFYGRNGLLFVDERWPWPRSLEENWIASIAARLPQNGARLLAEGGSRAFVDRVAGAGSAVLNSLVVTHLSFSILARIKESDEDIIYWHGDIVSLSCSCGTLDFDSMFRDCLPTSSHFPLRLLQVLVSGFCQFAARIVISNNERKKKLAACNEKNLEIILQDLPDVNAMARHPMKLVEFWDEASFNLSVVEVTRPGEGSTPKASKTGGNRVFDYVPKYPLRMRGHIVQGFGRGSKKMGIPTANIDPSELPEEILQLPKGVYCGFAQVNGAGLDTGVHKMVMNIGNRPTFADGGGLSVEVHICHDYGGVDFYGMELSAIVLGFIREEMQFTSVGDLVQRIHMDIAIADKGLDEDEMPQWANDDFFYPHGRYCAIDVTAEQANM